MPYISFPDIIIEMATVAKATRSQKELYLIGSTVTELTGSKLPSMRMALGLFLHHHLELNETIRQSSASAITEIANFWQKARIPMRDNQNCQTKLEQTFEEWRLLKKNKGRKTSTQQAREMEFFSRFDDLFDVAHANALNMMTIQEDKDFLLAQRKKGRQGSMVGTDLKLAAKEKRAEERQKQMLSRHQRNERKKIETTTIELVSSDSDSVSSSEDEVRKDWNWETKEQDCQGAVGGSTIQTPAKRKRGRRSVLTPHLAAALDRTKVSDRKAVFVIAETAKSFGHNIDDLALNRDTIRRLRVQHRTQRSADIKAEFRGNIPLVVHWDGKLIPDLIGKEKVDRLPVLVSGEGTSQLLTVAKLPSGTGKAQAAAVFEAIEDWGLANSISAMCFDTTSSNTGRIAGACILLEQKLCKELLPLACRHHIMELVIGSVFQVCMGSTSSPEVPVFKRFQQHWSCIDHMNTNQLMAKLQL